MQLAHALLEEFLGLFDLMGDGKVHISRTSHQISTLAQTRVKNLSVPGVARQNPLLLLRCGGLAGYL
ncbi:MAG TPA: hypothetical protein VG125_07975, partial [Pirellulales bacterium]|nr:hypothetical protein [Pirellulales bacterium]